MHVLVTGGLGHIGSQLIRHLGVNETIERITVLDNLSTQRYCALFNLPSGAEYRLIEGDILEADDLTRALQGVEAVVHLAAVTNAAASFDDQQHVSRVNLAGTQQVIQACAAQRVERFIFTSTTSVYGPMSGTAREDCERHELRPQSPYATSKLAAEDEVLAATARGELPGVVLRLGTIFGPSPGMRFHTAVNKFVFSAATRQPLTVWTDAVGLVRPYLALQDGVHAIEFMLARTDVAGQIFNVVTLNATLDRILGEIRSHVPDLEIHYTQSRLLNQVSYEVDDTKIRSLGFTYSGDLSAGIRETLELLAGLLPEPFASPHHALRRS